MSDMRMPINEPGAQEAMQNVEANRSMLNPTDGAMMAQQGKIGPGQTVGQFMETVFHVKWEDPIEKLTQAAQSQLKNRTPTGKAQALAQGAGGQPPMPPQGGMPQGQPQGQPPGGMMEMMSQMG